MVGLTEIPALALSSESNTMLLGHSDCFRDVHVTQAGPMIVLPGNVTVAIRREALSAGVNKLVECNLELLVAMFVQPMTNRESLPYLGMKPTQESKIEGEANL